VTPPLLLTRSQALVSLERIKPKSAILSAGKSSGRFIEFLTKFPNYVARNVGRRVSVNRRGGPVGI
jgi:hypothetical protein